MCLTESLHTLFELFKLCLCFKEVQDYTEGISINTRMRYGDLRYYHSPFPTKLFSTTILVLASNYSIIDIATVQCFLLAIVTFRSRCRALSSHVTQTCYHSRSR